MKVSGAIRTTLLVVAILVAVAPHFETAAATTFNSSWFASSGLFPDQVSPPWALTDSATPEDPVLSGGVLTISTSTGAENMRYTQAGTVLVEPVPDPWVMEGRLRFVSGGSSHVSRAPVTIQFQPGPFVGNVLMIGKDEIWLLAGDLVRGATALVDTDGAFHTYRIGLGSGGAISVFYDDVLTLTGTTFGSPNVTATSILFWGEGSSLAFGISEWEFFRHNGATVPGPAALVLLGLGLAGIGARRGYRRR